MACCNDNIENIIQGNLDFLNKKMVDQLLCAAGLDTCGKFREASTSMQGSSSLSRQIFLLDNDCYVDLSRLDYSKVKDCANGINHMAITKSKTNCNVFKVK